MQPSVILAARVSRASRSATPVRSRTQPCTRLTVSNDMPPCFLQIHIIVMPSAISNPPDTDFLSVLSATKSVSLYQVTLISFRALLLPCIRKRKFLVSTRYLTTLREFPVHPRLQMCPPRRLMHSERRIRPYAPGKSQKAAHQSLELGDSHSVNISSTLQQLCISYRQLVPFLSDRCSDSIRHLHSELLQNAQNRELL